MASAKRQIPGHLGLDHVGGYWEVGGHEPFQLWWRERGWGGGGDRELVATRLELMATEGLAATESWRRRIDGGGKEMAAAKSLRQALELVARKSWRRHRKLVATKSWCERAGGDKELVESWWQQRAGGDRDWRQQRLAARESSDNDTGEKSLCDERWW